MLLKSTILNFADSLTPAKRLEYLAVVMTVPLHEIRLEVQDKMRMLMNEGDILECIDEDKLQFGLDAMGVDINVASIVKRAPMITPVDELGAYGNYLDRISRL